MSFKIKNRYGQYHTFEKNDNGLYSLKPNLDSIRIIYEEDNENIFAIDPDGGPFMTKGYMFDNGKMLNDIIIINNKLLLKIE